MSPKRKNFVANFGLKAIYERNCNNHCAHTQHYSNHSNTDYKSRKALFSAEGNLFYYKKFKIQCAVVTLAKVLFYKTK
jgi:hypothetical protein